MPWLEQGKDPDYRFSLANERTFLAWIRTALAMLAGAILLHQFATRLEPRWVNLAASGSLACVAALLGAGAYVRWRSNEIAMRLGQSLPRSTLMPLLAAAVALLGIATCIFLVAS
jgi:putative membrane protein